MIENEKISIRECLLKNNYKPNKSTINTDRFNLDEDSIKIIDKYNELPEINFANMHEAEDLTKWLNKHIKPKNILEILYHEKYNNETFSKKIEEHLKENKIKCCKVYVDSLFLIFEYNKDDYNTPKKVLELFDLTHDQITYKSVFTTKNNCEMLRTYFLWSDIHRRWL